MIDVWGADHGGYVKRMKAAVTALSHSTAELDVKLCQLVKLTRGGEPVRMSKRAGNFVTLREVVDEVGKDVVRFIMLTRRNDAPLDFDFGAVTEQSRENPVFYVQYAHARACSVLRNVAEVLGGPLEIESLKRAELARLTHADELALIKLLGGWPRLIETAAEAYEPHRVAFYIHDVASAFHQYWNQGKEDPDLRFIVDEDTELTVARASLVKGVASVIASGLEVMGVQPVEEMR
jgi:arginyl-tRNA synthetase